MRLTIGDWQSAIGVRPFRPITDRRWHIVNLRLLRSSVLAGIVLMACMPPPSTKKVLIIGIDGVRVDILGTARTPHIDSLIAHGTFSNDAETEITWSGPSWSSMVTGVWSAKHGITRNDLSPNRYAAYPDVLTLVERERPSQNTFAVLNWPPLGTAADGGPLFSDAIDVKVSLDGDSLGYDVADSLAVAAAADHLRNANPDLAFVYLGNIDVVAHELGALTAEYRSAIERADRQVGLLLAAVRGRVPYAAEDWLILASTDHGHRDEGGHGGTSVIERRIFYLASGPSARRGRPARAPRIVDIAVTALAHLGFAIDPAWGLDGEVVGLR